MMMHGPENVKANFLLLGTHKQIKFYAGFRILSQLL